MGLGLKLFALHRDGSRLPVDINLSPLIADDGTRHTVVFLRDATERERLLSDLQAATRRAETANQRKTDFLAAMSHELRSPLHTIIGFTELLQEQIEGPITPAQEGFLSYIRRDSQHLLDLINDILDLSKIEAGKLELHCQPIAIADAGREALATVAPQAHQKQVNVANTIDAAAEAYADRIRLQQILVNLLTNAIKFTPSGGNVALAAVPCNGQLAISIQDSGVGIAGAEIPYLFDVFFQANQSKPHQGTGLGLAITKRLVEQHGGRLTVVSTLGAGSCFTFTLPVVA